MISASTMPPSLRSTVIDTLAQVAWLGSGCGSTSKRLGFLVGTRAPIGTDSMGTCRVLEGVFAECFATPDGLVHLRKSTLANLGRR